MTVSIVRDRAIDYAPCRYNGSRIWFRGPRKSLRAPYLACLGGADVYGRYLNLPFSELMTERINRPVVNLGVENAGLDAFLNDPGCLNTAAGAKVVLIQLTGSQNTSNRYYTVQVTDEWGEVITNLNERNYPFHPYGKFALVAQGADVDLPDDAVRIDLRSSKAKILARVALEDDPEGAVALQNGYKVSALGDVDVTPVVDLPMFDNDTLIGVELFEYVEDLLKDVPDVSPVAAQLQAAARVIADMVKQPEQRTQIDDFLSSTAIPDFTRFAVEESGAQRNNWVGTLVVGNYGEDFDIRTAANLVGIWANARHEVIYYVTARDADGALLDGSNRYVMRFPADALPQDVVNEFWSLTLVGFPDFMPVANPLNRHVVSSYTGVERNADGSLTLFLGPKPDPGFPEANWLPTKAGQPFSLTFRTYVPKEAVKTGEWFVPAVEKIN